MNPFFSYLDRLKLIRRWGLMRNTIPENDMEHSMQTALIAHGLAVIGNTHYGRNYDPGEIVLTAMYHDISEVITGDLPTPVKYKSPDIQEAYRGLEDHARVQLLDMLPKEMRSSFKPYILADENSYTWRIVKAADRISAYLKCLEEIKMGNSDFSMASETILESIQAMGLPEVREFMEEYVPAFALCPDELSKM